MNNTSKTRLFILVTIVSCTIVISLYLLLYFLSDNKLIEQHSLFAIKENLVILPLTLGIYISISVLLLIYMYLGLKNKRYTKSVHYHQTNLLPNSINLQNTFATQKNKRKENIAFIAIRPAQYKNIKNYLDEKSQTALLQNFAQQLSHLFTDNHDIIPLTEQQEKLCLLDDDTLMILSVSEQHDIPVLIEKIQLAISQGYQINTLTLPLSAYVGVANYPEHGLSCSTLIKHAVCAISNAEAYHDKWAYYQHDLSSKNMPSAQLAVDIKQAIEQKNFQLYHQAQIDLKTNKVCGSECLLRWHHPTLAELSPDTYIPVAEDFGFMPELTLWVVKTALQQQTQLQKATGLTQLISINISVKDLLQAHFAEQIAHIVAQCDINADKIIFEISSSIPENVMSLAKNTLEKLAMLGIVISINSSYFSLTQLKKLTFDELKINKKDIDNQSVNLEHNNEKNVTILNNKTDMLLMESTIKIAKAFNADVVAQGINTIDDERIMLDYGCDIGQGNYYAKAMNYHDYCDWLCRLNNGQVPEVLEGEFIPHKKDNSSHSV